MFVAFFFFFFFQKEVVFKEKDEDWGQKLNLKCRRAAQLKRKNFCQRHKQSRNALKRKWTQRWKGGESFNEMNGLFSTEDIDDGGSPP